MKSKGDLVFYTYLPLAARTLSLSAAEDDDYGGGLHHPSQQQGGDDGDSDEEQRPIYRPSAERLRINLSQLLTLPYQGFSFPHAHLATVCDWEGLEHYEDDIEPSLNPHYVTFISCYYQFSEMKPKFNDMIILKTVAGDQVLHCTVCLPLSLSPYIFLFYLSFPFSLPTISPFFLSLPIPPSFPPYLLFST